MTRRDVPGSCSPPWVAQAKQAAVRAAGGQRVQRGLVRALVEHARAGSPSPAGARPPAPRCDDPGHLGVGVVEVADQDRPRRADRHAGRLQADVQAVRAQVALLRRVVLGVDEDRVIRAGRDARLAADADAPCRSRRSRRARWYMASVGQAATHGASAHWLHRVTWNDPADLRERPDVHGFDVGPGHSERHLVLALARGRAGVAADARGPGPAPSPSARAAQGGRSCSDRKVAGLGDVVPKT